MIYRINTTPIKIPAIYFKAIDARVYVERQKATVASTVLKKNKVRKLTLPTDFETHYKATVTKTVALVKEGTNNQWNRIESSEKTHTDTVK